MDAIQGLALALPLAVAFFVALAMTPLAGRLATRIGAVDRPSARGVNQRPGMPLLGGLAVAGGFFAAMLAVAGGLARHVLCFRTVWEATYGALAGALALLFWMWLSNLALVIGAELSQVASE